MLPAELRDHQRFTDAAQKASIYARDGGRCVYCSIDVLPNLFHADHDTAHSRGGSTSLENLVTACEACNIVKGWQTGASYRHQLRSRGLKWRDQEYSRLREEERLRLEMEHPIRVDIDDVVPVQTLSEGTWSEKTTQSPTGIFGRLQADAVGKHAASIRTTRRQGPAPKDD
jgi:HNH endonuclease